MDAAGVFTAPTESLFGSLSSRNECKKVCKEAALASLAIEDADERSMAIRNILNGPAAPYLTTGTHKKLKEELKQVDGKKRRLDSVPTAARASRTAHGSAVEVKGSNLSSSSSSDVGGSAVADRQRDEETVPAVGTGAPADAAVVEDTMVDPKEPGEENGPGGGGVASPSSDTAPDTAPEVIKQPQKALLFYHEVTNLSEMYKNAIEIPGIEDLFTRAQKILGWNPAREIGYLATIHEARYLQPLIFIESLAAFCKFKDLYPEDDPWFTAAAGVSVGEYAAIVAAGVLSFEDGLTLVKIRGEAMQKAAEAVPQGMCDFIGRDRAVNHREEVDRLCEMAKTFDSSPNPVCKVACSLSPNRFICSGTKESMEWMFHFDTWDTWHKATIWRIPDADVFHSAGALNTSLVQPAQDELNKALDDMQDRMNPPRCAIYFNATGERVPAGADPATFIELMKTQLTNEVKWEKTIKGMITDGVEEFIDLGLGCRLSQIIEDIDPSQHIRNIRV